MKKRLLALITSSAFMATVLVNPAPANANGYLDSELVIQFEGTSGDTLCLPIYGTYDLEVDWDDTNGYVSESGTDSSPEDYLNFDSTTAGSWVVKIKEADGNTLKRFGFDEDELKEVARSPADLWDSDTDCFKRMTKVLNWGNWVSDWTLAFADQQNLTTVPNATPGNDPTSFQSMFDDAENFTGSDADPSTLSDWDTSTVTNMESVFEDAENFKADISGWDTSNVSRMDNMFENASVFESDISGWVTSSVSDMSDMFKEATVFDSDIGGWDVSNVIDFNDMFEKTDAFNADIGGWTIGEEDPESTLEIAIDNMFYQATAFNSDLNDWNVSNVTEMQNMFEGATVFNGDISDWDTSSVTDMKDMFKGAFEFGKEDKQDIGGWVTSSVTDMSDMFKDAAYFNQDIGGWDVANVTDFSQMFYGADSFNQDIGSWKTGNVEQMQSMFEGAVGHLKCRPRCRR